MGISPKLLNLVKSINLLPDNTSRSLLLKKNIVISFLIKGMAILISLLLVPLTLDFLSAYEYGLWLTISSIFTWINYFDIGLGNGLRNRLTESMAEGNIKLGQIYVSTTLFILATIIAIIFLIFLSIQPLLNWSAILNSDSTISRDLNTVVIVSFALFCISFVFKIIGIIYAAAQKPAINDLINLLGSLLSLIFIFILTKVTEGSLMKVAIALSAAPVIVVLIAYPVTFFRIFKDLKPKWKAIQFNHAKDLMNLGFQFFMLQIAALLIFGTSNIIISRILGPDQVTPFNIAFKYFSIATMSFNIIITPMWSASTDAYAQNDYTWIRKSMKGMIKISMISTLIILGMILISDFVYRMWIGSSVVIPLKLTISMGLYSLVILWSTCYSTFLFGIGKLRLQLINTILMAVLFIPLAVWLTESDGVSGAVLALLLINLSGAILNPIQFYKIIQRKAIGIWNK
jgi:O-antigen/teichoic acid export membrane protein